jgi:hypothetical protein
MKKALLMAVLAFLVCTKAGAQSNNYELAVTNNTSCTIYFLLIMSTPQLYPATTCTSGSASSLIAIPPGGFRKYGGAGTVLPPGVPAPPAGYTCYFLQARIFHSSNPSCPGLDLGVGDLACGASSTTGTITTYNPSNCQPACSNVSVIWGLLYPGVLSLTFN